MGFPSGEPRVFQRAARPVIGESRVFTGNIITVIVHRWITGEGGQTTKFIGITDFYHLPDEAEWLAYNVMVNIWVNTGRGEVMDVIKRILDILAIESG